MIDTVVLRIHGYEKYYHLVKYLEQINTKDYVKKINHPDEMDINKTSLFYSDSSRLLHLTHRSSIHVASSHYDISFVISKEKDFIEFNFSVPKYVHSTNVLQFVDHYDTSLKHTFDKLHHLITRFFAEYLPLPPEWLDVEVNRIDLCYNQFFLSKGDALRYLDEQRKLNVQHARSDKNRFSEYGGTTVQYVTANYSFKIYHKGTEFYKNDYNKLVKNNPKGFNLAELKDIADKVLRYEITFRKPGMNYIFRQKLKDNENTVFNHNFEMIRKTKTKTAMAFVKNGKKGSLIARYDKQFQQFEKDINTKSYSFFLDSYWDHLNVMPIQLITNYKLCFNFELFEALHGFFWQRVQNYQLGVKMGITEIHEKIKQHQGDKAAKNRLYATSEKVAQTGQLLLLATLSQYTDISDLKGVIPKAPFYRYRKKLEELGIPRYSPDIAVRPPELDYQTYFFYFSKYHIIYN